MGPIVVFLDVCEIGCFLESGIVPVEVFQPSVDVRVGVSDWCGAGGEARLVVMCVVRGVNEGVPRPKLHLKL
jgi:hypothetical protein